MPQLSILTRRRELFWTRFLLWSLKNSVADKYLPFQRILEEFQFEAPIEFLCLHHHERNESVSEKGRERVRKGESEKGRESKKGWEEEREKERVRKDHFRHFKEAIKMWEKSPNLFPELSTPHGTKLNLFFPERNFKTLKGCCGGVDQLVKTVMDRYHWKYRTLNLILMYLLTAFRC